MDINQSEKIISKWPQWKRKLAGYMKDSTLFQCAKCRHVYDPEKKNRCPQCGHEKTETRMIG